jgi:hypothetical protein
VLKTCVTQGEDVLQKQNILVLVRQSDNSAVKGRMIGCRKAGAINPVHSLGAPGHYQSGSDADMTPASQQRIPQMHIPVEANLSFRNRLMVSRFKPICISAKG